MYGQFEISLQGEQRYFHYPDQRNTGSFVRRVLSGREYPLFQPPDWHPQLIVDIGANIGAAAMQFLGAYPLAVIHCFEPSSEAFELLEMNTAGLGRVFRHEYGISSSDGECRLYIGKECLSGSSLYLNGKTSSRSEKVKVRRASDVFRELNLTGCDILKIDTEGSELPIIRDLGSLLSGPDALYVEYHSENDRIEIDRLVQPYFALWCSTIYAVNCGVNVYLSHKLLERYPKAVVRPIISSEGARDR